MPWPLETFNTVLAPVRDKIPQDLTATQAGALARAVTAEALARVEAFLSGVKAYQASPIVRPPDKDAGRLIGRFGTTRLLDYSEGPAQDKVILVLPSLINRFTILDLEERHSFLRFLAAQGFAPLVVDWAEPGPEEETFDLSAYTLQRLAPVLDAAQARAGGRPVHLLGYCMGGVLALALALLKPDAVASLGLLATPWDFASGGIGGMPAASTATGRLFLDQALRAGPYLEQAGFVPPSWVQTLLTVFHPLQILQKFARFASLDSASDEARRFVLTEDWLNDGVPLSLPVAREWLTSWYEKNALAQGLWRVGPQIIDPATLTKPCFLVAAQRDRIVPPASALALARKIKACVTQEPDLGHIGLMAGRQAPALVWAPYAAWLTR